MVQNNQKTLSLAMSDDDALQKPAPPNMAWLLTFADLVSLLITFFVLLFSMKTVDESQWDVLKGTMMGVFAQETSEMVVHPEDFDTTEVIPEFPAESLLYLQTVLQVEFGRDATLSQMRTRYDQRRDVLFVTLPAAALFDSGTPNMTREGRIAVAKLADKLRHLDNRIQISAHTAPGRLRDPEIPTNWELTMQQAVAVAQVMHGRGLDERIPAVGYGDSRFDGSTAQLSLAERYRQARRVEIEIYGDSHGSEV